METRSSIACSSNRSVANQSVPNPLTASRIELLSLVCRFLNGGDLVSEISPLALCPIFIVIRQLYDHNGHPALPVGETNKRQTVRVDPVAQILDI